MTEIPEWLKPFLRGWHNVVRELIWHFEPGQTVTLVKTTGPFTVPTQIGGEDVLESVQHTFGGEGVGIARVLESEDVT